MQDARCKMDERRKEWGNFPNPHKIHRAREYVRKGKGEEGLMMEKGVEDPASAPSPDGFI